MNDNERPISGFGIRADEVPPLSVTADVVAKIRAMEAGRIGKLFGVEQWELYQLVALREKWAAWCEANPTKAGYTWPAAWKAFRESGGLAGPVIAQR